MSETTGEESMKFDTVKDGLAGLPEGIENEPVGPMVGIDTIALNMALKYHDITTVQDGTLYQQFKLEGKNMHGLHLDEVFHTAVQIEQHLIAANKRVAQMMVLACLHEETEDREGAVTADSENEAQQTERPKPAKKDPAP